MNTQENAGLSGQFSAAMIKRPSLESRLGMRGHYSVICRNSDGDIKWVEKIVNRVVLEGLDYALDVALSGGTQITSWFIGLTDGTPTDAAADTLASHAGWVEVTAFAGDRKAFVDAGVSSQSLSNTASPAAFAIDTDSTTIGGAFLCSVATGTGGTLYSIGAFSGGDKSADDGDTLNVTYTASSQDV